MIARTYRYRGSTVTPKNGSQHVALEAARRRRQGLPPLTPVEVTAIWHYRATGMLRPPVRGI